MQASNLVHVVTAMKKILNSSPLFLQRAKKQFMDLTIKSHRKNTAILLIEKLNQRPSAELEGSPRHGCDCHKVSCPDFVVLATLVVTKSQDLF